MITVKDLIAELKKFDLDQIVILAKYPEGSLFSPMQHIEQGMYTANSEYSGYFDLDMSKKVSSNSVKAVVLYPKY